MARFASFQGHISERKLWVSGLLEPSMHPFSIPQDCSKELFPFLQCQWIMQEAIWLRRNGYLWVFLQGVERYSTLLLCGSFMWLRIVLCHVLWAGVGKMISTLSCGCGCMCWIFSATTLNIDAKWGHVLIWLYQSGDALVHKLTSSKGVVNDGPYSLPMAIYWCIRVDNFNPRDLWFMFVCPIDISLSVSLLVLDCNW